MHSYRTDSGGGSGEIVAWRQAASPFVPATAKPRRLYSLLLDAAAASLIGANSGGAAASVSAGTMTAAAGSSVATFTGGVIAAGTMTPAAGSSVVSASGSMAGGGTMTPAAGSSVVSATGSVTVAGTLSAAAGSSVVSFASTASSTVGDFVPAASSSIVAFGGALTSAGDMLAAGKSTVAFVGRNYVQPSGDWLMYATEDDMVARFGAEEMSDLSSMSDLVQALRDASEEAQSYVAVRYHPPLPNVPAPLVSATCDIARYRMYKDRATEQVKERYEAQVKWLTRVSDGKAVLTFNPSLTPEQAEVIEAPVTPVGAAATQGVFGDDVFARMPNMRCGGYW